MKKHLQRIMVVSLFTMSIGAACAIFSVLSFAPPAYAAKCPSCNGDSGCVGSTCNCEYEGGSSFYCSPPVK